MKCPKCGFNSFEHLENCKKCGRDLAPHKTRFGLRSLLFPGRETPPPEEPPALPQSAEEPGEPITAAGATDFGFNFMGSGEENDDQPAETSLESLLGGDESPEDEKSSAPPEEDSAAGESLDFGLPAADALPFAEDAVDLEAETGDPEAFIFNEPEVEPSPTAESAPLEKGALDGESLDFDLPAADDLPFAEDAVDLETETGDPEAFIFDETEEEPAPAAESDPLEKGTSAGEPLDFDFPSTDDLAFAEEAGDLESFSFDQIETDFSPAVESAVQDVDAADEPELIIAPKEGPDNGTAKKEAAKEKNPPEGGPDDPLNRGGASRHGGPPENVREKSGGDERRLAAPGDDETSGENLAEIFLGSIDGNEDDGRDGPAIETGPSEIDFSFADDDAWASPTGPAIELTADSRETTDATEPEEDSGDLGEDLRVPAAGTAPLAARLAAGAIDLGILALVFALFLVTGKMALANDPGKGFFPSLEALADLAIPYFLILFAVCFGYFTLFHFLTGQTPGKMLFKLRVESEQGMSLRFSQAFLRSVGGLLSLIPAGLGYLRILLDREQRGWNDRLAGSRVVPAGDGAEEAIS